MKKQSGFTLPELLVVLVLMSILFMMVVPSFAQSWQQLSLDYSIQQLHRDLRWAQRIAAREQKQVSITFFQDQQPYRYVIRLSGQSNYLRKRILQNQLQCIEAQTILIKTDKSFQKNGHILFQKGEEQRYVYYYQTGRTRLTKTAIS